MSNQPVAAPIPGGRRAAILLISLGNEVAAQVLKRCDEKAVERLTMEMFNTFGVTSDEQSAVLTQAYKVVVTRDSEKQGGLAFMQDLLVRAMGKERAEEFVSRLMDERKEQNFVFLNNADPEPVAGLLKNEHPQAIALILSHLQPSKAAKILAKLDPDLQAEVASRIAMIERIAPEVVKGIELNLQKRMASALTSDDSGTQGGGVGFLVQILNQERSMEKRVLESLAEKDPEMAEQIKNNMFVFEDIVDLDDRTIQRLLRDVDQKDLVLAIRGAKSEVREHIMRNMSKRAAELLNEELAIMRPVRMSSIEQAQQRIVGVIRRLEESEEIVISRGGQGDVLI
jgi:flagellar motor switch protein FliG